MRQLYCIYIMNMRRSTSLQSCLNIHPKSHSTNAPTKWCEAKLRDTRDCKTVVWCVFFNFLGHFSQSELHLIIYLLHICCCCCCFFGLSYWYVSIPWNSQIELCVDMFVYFSLGCVNFVAEIKSWIWQMKKESRLLLSGFNSKNIFKNNTDWYLSSLHM